jgi:hypothetical protein
MSWTERSTGISPTITKFLSAHIFGRIDGIDADIARDPRADRGASGPFHVEDDLGHQGPRRRGRGRSADTLVLAQVEC